VRFGTSSFCWATEDNAAVSAPVGSAAKLASDFNFFLLDIYRVAAARA
jgi:hypothetical protein